MPAGTLVRMKAKPDEEFLGFTQSDGTNRYVWFPKTFEPMTQLEFARLGEVTPEMRRVAEREDHLTADQVRDEVAAGRLVIPANRNHLQWKLDPMAIGRASQDEDQCQYGCLAGELVEHR